MPPDPLGRVGYMPTHLTFHHSKVSPPTHNHLLTPLISEGAVLHGLPLNVAMLPITTTLIDDVVVHLPGPLGVNAIKTYGLSSHPTKLVLDADMLET